MFDQHPVPQQISSYQFRLIGDMTIKQFFQLAGGALISLLIYASPFPAFLKWPLIIIFTIAGAALAFLPIQERPLDKWFIAFFRSIYQPTQYYWEKGQTGDSYFQPDGPAAALATTPAPQTTPVQANPAAEFLTNLENTEKSVLSKISTLFTSKTTPQTTAAPTIQTPVNTAPIPQPAPTPVAISSFPIAPAPTIQPKVIAQEVKQEISIPTVQKPSITPQGYAANTTPLTQGQTLQPVQVQQVSQTFNTTQATEPTQSAKFSPDAAPPYPPSQANVVVGQVMDASKKVIEGAILEIKDNQGRPVRALRSNKAGHFLIATPLVKGTYNITIDKDGYTFDTLQVEVNDTLIEPMAIQAKA